MKSSALKILKANNDTNVNFIFEAMQVLRYEVGGHERHWISKFAPMQILVPSFSEQTKIANFLAALDRKIESVSTQIRETQTFKRGLLQQMFV